MYLADESIMQGAENLAKKETSQRDRREIPCCAFRQWKEAEVFCTFHCKVWGAVGGASVCAGEKTLTHSMVRSGYRERPGSQVKDRSQDS